MRTETAPFSEINNDVFENEIVLFTDNDVLLEVPITPERER